MGRRPGDRGSMWAMACFPDQLDSPVDILTQSAMFTSLKDTERQRGPVRCADPARLRALFHGELPGGGRAVVVGAQRDTRRPTACVQLRELARKAGMGPGPLHVNGPSVPDTCRWTAWRCVPIAVANWPPRASNWTMVHRRGRPEERVDLLYGPGISTWCSTGWNNRKGTACWRRGRACRSRPPGRFVELTTPITR